MKKIVALIMALCLLTGFALAEATEINWADMEAAVAEVEGDFVTFDEVAVKMWLPSMLQATELTDEDREEGYIGYFADADQEAQVAVVYVNMDGMSLEDYAAQLPEYGATEIEMAKINGLDAVTYQLPENDSVNVTFTTEAGYVLEISMAPLSAENAEYVWAAVAASIQAE